MIARPPREPRPHGRMRVRRIVIEDEVHVELGGDARVDVLEKGEALLMPTPALALGEPVARPDLQGRKERGGPTPRAPVRAPYDVAQAQGGDWVARAPRLGSDSSHPRRARARSQVGR